MWIIAAALMAILATSQMGGPHGRFTGGPNIGGPRGPRRSVPKKPQESGVSQKPEDEDDDQDGVNEAPPQERGGRRGTRQPRTTPEQTGFFDPQQDRLDAQERQRQAREKYLRENPPQDGVSGGTSEDSTIADAEEVSAALGGNDGVTSSPEPEGPVTVSNEEPSPTTTPSDPVTDPSHDGFNAGNPFEGAAAERERAREFNQQREVARFGGGPGETRAEIEESIEKYSRGELTGPEIAAMHRNVRLYNASRELHGQQVTELNVANAAAGTGIHPNTQLEIVDDLRSGDPDRIQSAQDQIGGAQTLAYGERVAAHGQASYDWAMNALADVDIPTTEKQQLASDLSSANSEVRQAALDNINNHRTLAYGESVSASAQTFHDIQTHPTGDRR